MAQSFDASCNWVGSALYPPSLSRSISSVTIPDLPGQLPGTKPDEGRPQTPSRSLVQQHKRKMLLDYCEGLSTGMDAYHQQPHFGEEAVASPSSPPQLSYASTVPSSVFSSRLPSYRRKNKRFAAPVRVLSECEELEGLESLSGPSESYEDLPSEAGSKFALSSVSALNNATDISEFTLTNDEDAATYSPRSPWDGDFLEIPTHARNQPEHKLKEPATVDVIPRQGLSAEDLAEINRKCEIIQSKRTRRASTSCQGDRPDCHYRDPPSHVSTVLHSRQPQGTPPDCSMRDAGRFEQLPTSKLTTFSLGEEDSPEPSETEEWSDETECSDSTFPDSPDSNMRCRMIRPLLSPVKQDLVNRVMGEFHSLFDVNTVIRSHAGGYSGGANSMSTYNDNGSGSGNSSSGGKKRKGSEDNFTPPNGGSGDDPGKKRRSDPSTTLSKLASGRKLACPFFKRNPDIHSSNRSCMFPGFPSISRVKEHIYRNHALPIQCPRCCQTFPDEDACREHQRALEGCERREQLPLEGISKAQEARLRSKKRSVSTLTEEEKWKLVYKIIFPLDSDEEIPSPWCDYNPTQPSSLSSSPGSTELARFESYSRQQLPRLVRTSVENLVNQDNQLQLLEERLKGQLVDIFHDCQEQLFSMYEASRRTAPGTPSRSSVSGPSSSTMNSTALGPIPSLSTQSSDLAGLVLEPPTPGLDALLQLDDIPELSKLPSLCESYQQESGYRSVAMGSPPMNDTPQTEMESQYASGKMVGNGDFGLEMTEMDGTLFDPAFMRKWGKGKMRGDFDFDWDGEEGLEGLDLYRM